MRKSVFLLLTFCLCFHQTYSQNKVIDSLSKEFYNAKSDTLKARILASIGIEVYRAGEQELAKKYTDSLIRYSKTRSKKYLCQGFRMKGTFALLDGKYDSSKYWYNKGLVVAKEMRNKEFEAYLYENLGTIFGRLNIRDSSRFYYRLAIDLNKENNNERSNVQPLLNLAIGATKLDDIEKSIQYLVQAIEIADRFELDERADIHNQMAIGYLKLDNEKKAIEHLTKGLQLATESGNNYQLGSLHNSYGYLFEDRKDDFENALLHYEKSLYFKKRMGNKLGIIQGMQNVGLQQSRLGRLNKAEKSFKESLLLAHEIDDKEKIVFGNYYLAEVFALRGNIDSTQHYINKAQGLTYGSEIVWRDHYYRLSEYLENIGEYQLAHDMIDKYSVLSDSLFQKNNMEKIANIETKYFTEKKERENLQLKMEKAQQEILTQKANYQKRLAIVGLVLFFGTVLFVWKRYQTEKKDKKTIIKQKKVIEDLQRELHHRIKNNLSIIAAFIEHTKENIDRERTATKLSELESRIASINEVHDQLYKSDDMFNVQMKPYLQSIAENVETIFDKHDIKIINEIDEELILSSEKSFPLGQIVNECITNSYKYAFEKGGEIAMQMFQKSSGEYLLTVADNGKGLPDSFDTEKPSTFGMRIVRLLTKQLRGRVEIESNNGVKVKVSFPNT